jgi:GTP-binding protein
MPLEKALADIHDGELAGATGKSIRLRKRYLDSNEQKRMEKQAAAALAG